MSLSDNENAQKFKTPRRGVNQSGRSWSDAQKIEAVTLWLTMGNLALTAATLKIPEVTLRKWRATQWWKEIAEEIRLQERVQLSTTAKNIIDKSLTAIADRLEQGDWIYDQKTGQMRRKPVAMKDALAVADRLMDRKEKLDKMEVVNETSESVEAKLNKLMEKFTQVAAAVPAPMVTDVIFVEGDSTNENSEENHNAAHEEREEGLQLRQTVRGESEAGSQSGGEELSPEGDG